MRADLALTMGWLLLAPLPGHARDALVPAQIRVGIDASFPPYEFLNDRNEPDGFSVGLLRAVAEVLDLEVEFVAGPWREIREQIEMGQLDASTGMVRTHERERFLDFSAPTVLVEHVIFVPVDSSLETIEDVRAVGVVVQAGTIFDDKIQQDFPDVPRQTVATAEEALDAVIQGSAPAAILLLDQGLYLARGRGVEVRSIGGEKGVLYYRFAVTAGRSDLLHALNDGLHRVRVDGTYDALYDEWFGVLRPKGALASPITRALASAGIVLLALLAASLLWSRSLRARVLARTREVEERDREKLELERQLLQSQKMESLGRLGRRHARAHLRALLHHQGGGQGHRPRPRDRLRHRRAERWPHRGREPRWRRNPLPHRAAEGRRDSRALSAPAKARERDPQAPTARAARRRARASQQRCPDRGPHGRRPDPRRRGRSSRRTKSASDCGHGPQERAAATSARPSTLTQRPMPTTLPISMQALQRSTAIRARPIDPAGDPPRRQRHIRLQPGRPHAIVFAAWGRVRQGRALRRSLSSRYSGGRSPRCFFHSRNSW
jgi:ABC-type amino acid transport substrate-binding protein